MGIRIQDQSYLAAGGPFAKVIQCKVCGYMLKEPRPMRPGRGWAWAAGSRLYGQMLRHFCENHPDHVENVSRDRA